MKNMNSFNSKTLLQTEHGEYEIYSLDKIANIKKLPYSLKILLENLLRTEDGINVTKKHIESLIKWDPKVSNPIEIQFSPSRVIMQDFTGVPCIVDLATMREAIKKFGGDPTKVNPLVPVDLIIDHSVQVDSFGNHLSLEKNIELEYHRNTERYQFLRWGQDAFKNFKVVPPGTGIVHQVNIEHLATIVMSQEQPDGTKTAYMDTCVGTDSHTTMVNGMGVLGWGVGGIEAEAAMLGQPISMLIPQVVGFKITGIPNVGTTATDIVLTITEILRKHGVVGKFVEFYGPGISSLPLANRATIGNMSPEFGSTAAIFPIDKVTLDYLHLTGRSSEQITLVEQYLKTQGLWYDPQCEPTFSQYLELNLDTVVPSIAGPKRPQDRINLASAKDSFRNELKKQFPEDPSSLEAALDESLEESFPASDSSTISSSPNNIERPSKPTTVLDEKTGKQFILDHGSIGIAAITSCTNTSNPYVMVAAGILAKKASQKGLKTKPWVKTSLAPGSKIVTEYYKKSGLETYLDELGFNTVGYGCTTCIGNSGSLANNISKAIQDNDLSIAAVLSGNRNFEGRINPDIKMNYLVSPPLVVAYALVGTMDFDFDTEPIGYDINNMPIFLKDIWPTLEEISNIVTTAIDRDMFLESYDEVFSGDIRWRSLITPVGDIFEWDNNSTYVRRPSYFDDMNMDLDPIVDITGARVLVNLGDSVTTDHISPAGSFKSDSPAGKYLLQNSVDRKDFNSYGSRRGNHEVMIRGTFANIRLQNLLVPGVTGGFTKDFASPDSPIVSIYDAAQNYAKSDTPLIVLAGKEYGSGSSRDWAAKGTSLLGVKAVIAESYERIHRSNLIGMGVLPLEFLSEENANSLGLCGEEIFSILGVSKLNSGDIPETVVVQVSGSKSFTFTARVRIDTPGEAQYYRHGGILQYVLRNLLTN